MAKISINLVSLRRAYTVASENAKIQSSMRKTGDSSGKQISAEKGKEVFWIRDPKTGYWVPENHLGDVDVAELRAKLLSKKTNLS